MNFSAFGPLPSPAPLSGAREPDRDAAKKAKIFAADLPHGEDALGLEPSLQPLAELAVHRETEAPLTIGLLGGPGAGKSFALGKLMAAIEALSAASASHDGEAFLSSVLTVTIDAVGLSETPTVSLAAAVYEKLAGAFPELAREAAHAVRDPHVVAREAAEQLDIGRRRLDAERQNLAELESRRARLAETILFEQAGSQVDSYARANRAKIEGRLEGFGITGDAIQNYKSMVRDIAESGGSAARAGAALRAFWAFKGQTRLLVTAAVLILVSLGCDAATVHAEAWLGWLSGANAALVPTAAWLKAHIGWLEIFKQIALAGAALAVLTNLWRGARFLRPLFRGVGLLEAEVAHRRRDLDSLYAHQMRRVDALAADVELTGRRAAEADRRAASDDAARRDHAEVSPFDSITPRSQAERFFAALAAAVQRGWRGAEPVSATPMPHRIIIGLDNLDCLPKTKTNELLDAALRGFAHPTFITVIAADPQRLAAVAQSETAASDAAALEKWVQIPVRVGTGLGDKDYGALVAQALGQSEAVPETAKSRPKPLDWSVSSEELRLLAALAALAGPSPRAIKRFVNLYRIARARAPDDKPILAFMLALDQSGSAIDRAIVAAALASGDADAEFELRQGSSQLAAALASVRAAQGNVNNAAARRAAAIAQALSLRI